MNSALREMFFSSELFPTLLYLHQLGLQCFVLAELTKAVSDHDTTPPSLDLHLSGRCKWYKKNRHRRHRLLRCHRCHRRHRRHRRYPSYCRHRRHYRGPHLPPPALSSPPTQELS